MNTMIKEMIAMIN